MTVRADRVLAPDAMTYDGLGRIATVDAQGLWGNTSYGYDSVGNRSSKAMGSSHSSYTYGGKNRLDSALVGTDSISSMTLEWDFAGRLASSSDGSAYFYNGEGRRISKTEAAQATLYHYDASGRVLAESLADGTKLRDYIYVGNRLIAVDGCLEGSASSSCAARQWYHTDALGSVLARTDANGAVVAQFDYQPWGEQWQPRAVFQGDRQYNGRVFDQGTGFHDYGARMYWPQIGRFISPDTAGPDLANPATFNRYSYVLNNPYKYIDPTGHFAWLPWTMGAGAVVGGVTAGVLSYRAGRRGADLATDILGGIGAGGLAGTGIGLLADAAVAPAVMNELQAGAQQAEARAPALEGQAAGAAARVETTVHGAERIAGPLATRGGVLSAEEIGAVREGGRVMTQADGATVRMLQGDQGRFNIVVEGERGVITTFKDLSQKSVERLSKNYGWKGD